MSANHYAVVLSPTRRAIVTIHIEEDQALPAPLEKTDWKPTAGPPTRADLAHLITALLLNPVANHLQTWKN